MNSSTLNRLRSLKPAMMGLMGVLSFSVGDLKAEEGEAPRKVLFPLLKAKRETQLQSSQELFVFRRFLIQKLGWFDPQRRESPILTARLFHIPTEEEESDLPNFPRP